MLKKRKNQKENLVYIELQKHLDRQVIGFPATASGVELRILKHIFTPEEAKVAVCLRHTPEPLETVFSRAGHLFESQADLERVLGDIQKKGGIETRLKGGKKQYCNAPLVVGMYELQLERLTPEFIEDFNEYTRNKSMGLEFLGTKRPQMRTIPVGKSIHPQHRAATFDQISSLLMNADGPFVIVECICRKKKEMEGAPCKVTDRKETCLAIDGIAQTVLLSGYGREISRNEAMTIIEENQKEGLVLQPSNSEKIEFICSCCGCCCGMLEVHRMLPRPLDFWAANFQAKVDESACTGCGICEKQCQVDAVHVLPEKQVAAVDLHRCIGCGVCIPACPVNVIELMKKKDEVRPPMTREALNDILRRNRISKAEKLKLTGKLLVDILRTGHTGMLK